MSAKHDVPRTRTAEDLERKYNLAEMNKAIETVKETLNKINQNTNEFVNIIVGTLDNFEGLNDGKIVTYFYDGVPSENTYPYNTWENGTYDHINDLYYDRQSGKAYVLTATETEPIWIEVTDTEKIRVLALANATVDTKDNERIIFLDTPATPYTNGDLWLKDGVVYACQISKPETETYDEQDFIVSSSYNGDTLAVKIGKELEVLRGTVLQVINDVNFWKAEIKNLDEDTSDSIELLTGMFRTIITDANGESRMEQTENGWRFVITSLEEQVQQNNEKVNELEETTNQAKGSVADLESVVNTLKKQTASVIVGEYEGKPSVELFTSENAFKIVITNEEILFLDGTSTPAYIKNSGLNVENHLYVGGLAIVKRGNGHMSILPKGVI
jgi:hypothetical protein